MQTFLFSDAGKAVVGLLLTSILIIWPATAGWLAASFTLSFAVAKLRRAFERLEENEAAANSGGSDAPPIDAADRLAVGHAGRLPVAR